MAQTLALKHCKRVIALVWLIGAGVPFVLLVAQSLVGHYGASTAEVWSWYLGAVSPSVGLIIAVLAAEALQNEPGTRRVDPFFYRVAVGISIVYLVSVASLIFAAPMQPLEGGLPQLARESGAWLGALQGLVTASLGAFYVRKA